MPNQFFHSNVAIVPANQGYLPRPLVCQLLEKAIHSPLITVVAGAGYGKTQAVYAFLQEYNGVTTWLQLSETDNLRARFWENFIRAISLSNKHFAAQLAEIGFPETERQFDRYLTVPNEALNPDLKYILVFDDFHHIHDDGILRFVERSVNIPYLNSTTIIISRVEPAINTIPLLSKGLLVNISEEDLRFSQDEINDYFRIQQIKLSPGMVSAIYQDTEGWAFAINLLGLAIKHDPAGTGYARSSMKLNIFKLIEHEIWGTLSPDLQHYLIKLSLIDRWPRELLAALTSDKGLIEAMERIGSFIRFDSYLNAYRIHHLFLEYLSEKQHELSWEEKKEVYAQAAQWCGENQLRMDALSYYERIGDYQHIITISYTFPQIMANDIAAFLLELLDRAPKHIYECYTNAYAVRTRLLLNLGKFQQVFSELNAIKEQFEPRPFSAFNCYVLYGCYNNLGFHSLITCIDTRRYDFVQYFEQANHCFLTGKFSASAGPVNSTTIGTWVCRVSTADPQDLEHFIQALTQAVPYMANCMGGCAYGMDDLARCEAAYFKGDIPNAEQGAGQAVYKARDKHQYDIENRALFFLLRIGLFQGNPEKIAHVFSQLNAQLKEKAYIYRYTLYDIVMGWFYAQIGQTHKLAPWLKNDFEASDLNTLLHGLEIEVKIQYQLSEKRYPAVLALLESQEHTHTMGRFLFGQINLKIWEAICLYHSRETPGSFRALEEAYRLSRSNGLDMFFIEMGKDMRTLASAALQSCPCPLPRSWLEKILHQSSAYAKKLVTVTKYYTSQAQHASPNMSLSWREKKILTGLAQGLTREEIADCSSISINTVKAGISSVYNKLGAINRADAIRIATIRGIVSTEE
ncbi:MAG: LuxR C-terminal-related transcriptional regulator [Treponema sp.]|jgi:LuxR family maltose regulon positive regulatory protein|nr:LuxR C-terminal-related transcriptional regulator [Treponema sp.]